MSAYLTNFFNERRKNNDPVPADLEQVLTEAQLTTLARLESMDWFLLFVRRPSKQSPVPFLIDSELRSTAVIEDDGSLNRDHGLSDRWDFIF